MTRKKIICGTLVCAILLQSFSPFSWFSFSNPVYADTIPGADNATCVAAPVVTADVPTSVLQGETTTFSVLFANNGSEIGYIPYIDMILPASGVNYGGTDYAGLTLDSVILDAGTGDTVTHPYAIDGSGNNLVYNIGTGNKMVVIKIPFGSYAAGVTQEIDVSLDVTDDSGFLGMPLPIDIRGGYALGCDLDHQQSSVGTFDSKTLTPSNIVLHKEFNGREDETVAGPDFPKTYTIVGNIANNSTINDLVITDDLPFGLVYSGVIVTPAGATIIEPIPGMPTSSGNNRLEVHYGDIVGGPSAQDATITVEFYVDDNVVQGNGDATQVNNTATATANGSPTILASDSDPFFAKSIAVQKGVTNISGPSVVQSVPGNTIEYTLHFQISDYFAFSGITITDVIPDGLELDSGFSPTFSITTQSGVYNNTFISGDTLSIDSSQVGYDNDPSTNGSKALLFDVSKALENEGGDPYISGGVAGGAKGVITYRAIVQSKYTDQYNGNELKIGDTLNNSATIKGDMLDMDTMSLGGFVTDTTSAWIQIARHEVSKILYAINGSTTGSLTTIAPGDVVTYRVKYELPTTDTNSLMLTDYIPYPTFKLNTFSNTIWGGTPGDIPPANYIGYGTADTLHTLSGLTGTILPSNGGNPTIAINTTNNTISLDYGFIEDPLNRPSTIDLLISVEVSDSPLPDNTPLTNLISSNQGGYTSSSNTFGVQMVRVLQPDVKIRKGIIATSNTGSVFTTDIVPAGFDENTVSPSDPITTTNSVGYFDADLQYVQSGDIVRFAILLDNKGKSEKGAYDITISDTLPAGLQVPASGMNLHIINGEGTTIAYTKPDGNPATASDLFSGGIRLVDGTTGALADATTSGQNIGMIFYDLEVTDLYAGMTIANTATITHFANMDGGANFISFPRRNDANLIASSPTIEKTILATDQYFSSGNNVVIGEAITYNVDVIIPSNVTLSGFSVADTLDTGLAFSGFVGITGVNIVAPVNLQDIISSAIITATGFVLDFNNVAVDSANITGVISLQYDVIVLNTGSNVNNTIRNNTATTTWITSDTGDTLSATGSTDVRIIEPLLTMNKTRVAPAAGSRTVTYTLTIGNTAPSQSTGYDVLVTDQLDARLLYVPGSFTGSGWTGFDESVAINSGLISYGYDVVPLGTTRVVSFQAYLSPTINVTTNNVPNTGQVSRSSIPGSGANAGTLTGERISTINSNNATTNFTLNPVLTKSVVTTSESTTAGTGVAIGEIVTYKLHARIYEDTSLSGFMIRDTLPSGLQIVSGSVILQASGVLQSSLGVLDNTHPATVPVISGTTVDFVFGTLSNSDTGASTQEYVDITFDALVLNIVGNVHNTLLSNQALTRRNSSGSTWTQTSLIKAPSLTVVEPWIALSKTVTTPPTTGNRLVTYQVTLTNTGTAPGHEVFFYDDLPVGMNYVSGSLQHASGVLYTSSNISGNRIEIGYDTMSIGTTSTIVFQALLDTGIQSSQSTTNTGHVEWTGLPGVRVTERICGVAPVSYYCNLSSADITFNLTPQMTKEIIGHTGPFTIGEEVPYKLTVVLGENGNWSGLTVSDIADTGIVLTGVVATSVAPSLSSTVGAINTIPATMTASGFVIDLGNVTNNSGTPATIIYQYTGIVTDIPENQAGQTRTNLATVDWNNTPGWTASTGFIIGEPNIILGKSASYITGSRFITYTISVINTGTYTTTGYNIVLADVLSGTHYVTGSETHISGIPYTSFLTSDDQLLIDYTQLGIGEASVFSFGVELDENILSGAVVSNIITGDWLSVPGTGSRTYTISTGTNTSTFIISDLGISKSVTGASNISGGVLTYTIAYRNSSANTTQATIVDTLPLSGFTYMSSSPSGVLSGNQLIWDLQAGAGTTGTIIVTGVLNGTVSGDITNTATIAGLSNDVDLSNNTSTATYQAIFASDLSIQKTAQTVATPTSGSVVVYTLTWHNAGPNSTTGTIVDNRPTSGITLVDFTTGGSYTGNDITWELHFPANTTGVLILTGIVDGTLSGTISNVATIAGDNFDSDTSNNTSTTTGNTYFVSDLAVTKTVSSTSHQSGDIVVYTIDWANNGPHDTTGVVTDIRPTAGLDIVDTGIGYMSGSQVSGLQIIWSGYFAAHTTGSYVVTGRINTATPTALINTVSIVGDNVDLISGNNTASVTSNIVRLGGGGAGGGGIGGYIPPTTTETEQPIGTGSTGKNEVDKTIFNATISPNTCFNPLDQKTIYQGNPITQLFRTAHQMLYSYQLTKRRGTADYRPFDTLTREEAARFMVEFAEKVLCRKKTYIYDNNFNDIVGADPTLVPFIKESYEYVIFRGDNRSKGGYPTTFRPKEIINRDELIAVMIRLVTNKIKDSEGTDWAKGYRELLTQFAKTTTLGTDTQRGDTAETIYSLYKDNDYNLEDVGYVIEY